jgi:hypothetical protein
MTGMKISANGIFNEAVKQEIKKLSLAFDKVKVAVVDGDLILTFKADPNKDNDTLAMDDGFIQDKVDLELMKAGAKSVKWTMDTFKVVVSPESNDQLIATFSGIKKGDLGDDAKDFLSTIELVSSVPYKKTVKSKAASTLSRLANRIARKSVDLENDPVDTEF